MAACGLERIFEKPLPENPTLIESLSTCYQIQSVKPIVDPHVSEIFGELHFKENLPEPLRADSPVLQPIPSPPSPPPLPPSSWPDVWEPSRLERYHHGKSASLDSLLGTCKSEYMGCSMHGDCFISRNCDTHIFPFTEGLGFESSDELEADSDCSCERSDEGEREKRGLRRDHSGSFKVSRVGDGSYPPPLTCIGKMGKPSFRFQSYREDGRFILKEVRIQTMEFMHASREDGRLKLHLVQPDEPIQEDEDEYEEEEDDDIEDAGQEEDQLLMEDGINDLEGEVKSGMVEEIS